MFTVNHSFGCSLTLRSSRLRYISRSFLDALRGLFKDAYMTFASSLPNGARLRMTKMDLCVVHPSCCSSSSLKGAVNTSFCSSDIVATSFLAQTNSLSLLQHFFHFQNKNVDTLGGNGTHDFHGASVMPCQPRGQLRSEVAMNAGCCHRHGVKNKMEKETKKNKNEKKKTVKVAIMRAEPNLEV